MGTGYSGNYANTKGSKTINGFPTKINAGKQDKHIPSSNNYQQGKSIISISKSECQTLVDKYAGTGTKIGINKERVDFGKVIGSYVDPATGKKYPTTMGMMHYSKSGTHIVPATPKDFKEEK